MDIRFLDVSAVIGLCAAVALTINILLGMLLSSSYKKMIQWKKLPQKMRNWSLTDLHNWTAYIALALVLLHPLFLVLDKETKFTWVDVFFPVHAPHQPSMVVLGTLSMYAVLLVIITTQKVLKKQMGFRFWKNIHLISYLTALLFVIHGIFLDPDLKERPVDWLDGEKLVPEFCGLVLMVATYIRLRYYFKKKRTS